MNEKPTEWIKFIADPALGVQALHAHFNKHQYERHAHDYFAIGTIDAGAPVVSVEKNSFLAPPGSAMIINPGESHEGKPYDGHGYIFSMLYIEPWVIYDLSREHEIDTPATLTLTNSIATDPDIVAALRQLHRALFNEADTLERETCIIDAFTPLMQRHSTCRATSLEITNEPRIARVRDMIHESFSTHITTSDLAAAAGLSRVRLNQLFRAAYGLPLHAYLNSVRLEAAKELLRSGLPAVEVAASVGLSDQSHLIRRFKGSFGITPAQYVAGHFPHHHKNT